MFLTIHSPEGINSLENDIKCFTYRMEFEEKGYKKIDIDKVFDSRDHAYDNINYRNFTAFELDIKDKPLEYWCHVIVSATGKLLSTEKQVGYKDKVHEFVLCLQVTVDKKEAKDHFEKINDFCEDIEVSCRAFKLLHFFKKNSTTIFLTHISVKDRRPIIADYHYLTEKFQTAINITIINITSSDWCLPIYQQNLTWGLTPIGSTVKPSELCFTEHNASALRICEGDFTYGARWSEFNKECLEDADIPDLTKYLFQIGHEDITNDTFKNLSLITNRPYDFSVMDVSLLSDILYRISLSSNSHEDIYETFNNIFSVQPDILKSCQYLLNCTDEILNALDMHLTRRSANMLNESNYYLYTRIKRNLVIHITRPFLNNISGLALYGDSSTFLNYTIVDLYANTSVMDIELEELEAATYVPQKLLNDLTLNKTEEEKANLTVITTAFYNDSMFNEIVNNTAKFVDNKIINVIIPGYGIYLKYSLPLLLRRRTNSSNESCGYWAYGKNINGKKGKWSSSGINFKAELSNSSIILCAFSHLTHFALLVMNDRSMDIVETESIAITYDKQLSIITIACSVVSFIGIAGIFLTAIIYRQWREKLGTKFLLQLSITIILEIILIQIAGLENSYYFQEVCLFVGVVLQYVVLSKFCWMLVIAFLQYLRFVKVLGRMPSNLLLKSSLLGWCLPIAPVLFTAIVFPGSYSLGQNFCYPRGLALYIGLLIPCILVISANILVFIIVMKSIRESKAVRYDKSGKMARRQVYLAILLFFLLGIHWVFGIIAELLPNMWLAAIFMFLFCITCGLQGFVLFTFFVILDKDTRLLWTNSFKSRS